MYVCTNVSLEPRKCTKVTRQPSHGWLGTKLSGMSDCGESVSRLLLSVFLIVILYFTLIRLIFRKSGFCLSQLGQKLTFIQTVEAIIVLNRRMSR